MGGSETVWRIVSFLIAIFCLIESALSIALAYIGLSLYNCSIQVHYNESRVGYFVFLTYFYTDCAVSPNVELGIDDSTTSSSTNTTVTWPSRFESVYTAHQLNLAYAVLSCLWAATSLVLLGTSIFKTKILLGYLPWILTTVANLVLDIVATITFLQHLSKTKNIESFLNFLGAVCPPERVPDVPDKLTTMPAMAMTLVSSRFALLWLLNLILLICGLWIVWNLTSHSSKQKTKEYKEPVAETPSVNTESSSEPPRPFSYIPGMAVMKQADTTQQKPLDSEFQEKAALSKQIVPQIQRLKERLSNTYSPGIMPSEDEIERRSLSPSTRPPEELRGQLPWSYFNARDDLGPAANQPRSWDRPPVPVPDYTLHFGRKSRYSKPDDASSVSSSTSPYRLP